jgi:hypothetical protein
VPLYGKLFGDTVRKIFVPVPEFVGGLVDSAMIGAAMNPAYRA